MCLGLAFALGLVSWAPKWPAGVAPLWALNNLLLVSLAEEALFRGSSMAESPGFYAELLDRRNERWLPLLLPEVERGGAFIAVGAAHLLGDNGLLHVLEARGFKIARVR